jgi:hypothetical protein
MNKFAAVLSISTLAFATACSDMATSPLGPQDAAFNKRGAGSTTVGGSVSSQVTVAGSFSVTIPGGSGIRESGPGINEEGKELGECGPGGAWQNPSTKNWSHSVPHSHCVSAAGSQVITWAFSQGATFVVNGNNTNLNFANLVDHFVHFKGNQNDTSGEGIFTLSASGGTWTLDMNQFDASGNAFTSCDAAGRCLTATATFSKDGTEYPATATLSW